MLKKLISFVFFAFCFLINGQNYNKYSNQFSSLLDSSNYYQNKPKKAILFTDKYLKLAFKNGDFWRITEGYYYSAFNYYNLENNYKAISYLKKADSIINSHVSFDKLQYTIPDEIAKSWLRLNDLQRAKKYINISDRNFTICMNSESMSSFYNNDFWWGEKINTHCNVKIDYFNHLRQKDSVYKYLLKSEINYQKITNIEYRKIFEITTNINYAKYYKKYNNDDERTKAYLNNAWKLISGTDNFVVSDLQNTSNIYENISNKLNDNFFRILLEYEKLHLNESPENAIAIGDYIEKKSSEILDSEIILENQKLLSEAYKQIGQLSKSNEYLHKYNVNNLNIETYHKNSRSKLLNDEEIEKNREHNNFYVKVIVCCIIFGLIIFSIYLILKKKRKANNDVDFWKFVYSIQNIPILSKLIFSGTKNKRDPKRKYIILENFYMLTTILTFIFEVIFHLYIRVYFPAYIYIGLIFVMFIVFFIPLRHYNLFKLSVFIFLLYLTYNYSQYNFQRSALIELFYIPIVISCIIFFDLYKYKKYFFIIFCIAIFLFLLNFPNKYTNHYVNNIYKSPYHVLLSNVFLSLSNTVFSIYCIIKKYNISSDVKIKELESKVNDAFEEVVILAKNNSPEFLIRFKEVYPEFFYKLIIEFPDLTHSELKLCAYLKLNFTTKEISNYTFVSLRAVEGSKYRLRKKLNLTSDIDLNTWVLKFK
ncbi:helix-turn-helix transcriptional regulator [Chryseobacterium sp. SL1]|uniref:helix-turn-helix transcriptional regulator n=1 Tax=Chryseobacterium sp. SL1 TaxID=2995159 RepID=UPI00227459FD|nr:hypothetical protein [Chryseobacterium sp. SL1]MCY1660234.1 hypothetical protein [Chryseobacterium sp. SL1]